MVEFEIKGLDELIRELERLPKKIRKETERKFREAAYRIILSAQLKCPDPELRKKITYRVSSTQDSISVEIFAPEEAHKYLEEAFEENKSSVPILVAQAVEKALKK